MKKDVIMIYVLIIPCLSSKSYLDGVKKSNELIGKNNRVSLASDQQQAKIWLERKKSTYFNQVIEV